MELNLDLYHTCYQNKNNFPMEVERNHILIDKHLVNGPLKHAFFSYILKDRAIFRNLLANRYVEKK